MTTTPRRLATASLALATALPVTAALALPAQAGPQQPAPARSTSAGERQLDQVRRAAARAGVEARLRSYFAKRGMPMPQRPLLAAEEACQSETAMSRYVERKAASLSGMDQVFLLLTGADVLPTVDAATTPEPSAVDLTGKGGELRTNFKRLKGFWDTKGSDIELVSMDGRMLLDPARVSAAYVAIGVPKALADPLGVAVAGYMRLSPGLQQGRHTLLTFNAVAFSALGESKDPDRIAMGPGMLKAYDDLGMGRVAPAVVLAHEYGHHVQYELGMITAETLAAPTPDGTRHTELHADASAAYYVAHRKGAAFDQGRKDLVDDVMWSIGDCNLDSNGHHGSPAQRSRAGTWGLAQAKGASSVMPAAGFRVAYEKALPSLLSPTRPQLDGR